MVSTNSGDGHTQRSHCEEANGDDRRAVPLDKDHHSGAEEAEAEHHRGRRTDDVEAGSLPSWPEGEYVVRSHLGHSSPDAWGSATVHDSGPGDYIHGVEGTFGRNHP